MKEKLVVLRSRRTSTRDIFLGPLDRGAATDPFAAGPAVQVDVEIREVERKNIPQVTRSSDVVAVAPSIPMRLIAPVEVGTAMPAADEIAWGVQAVGADTSPFTGDGIVVSVLDTGIDANHAAFAGVQIVQKDFTGTGNGDQHGHGTHCAGTIFGRTTGGKRIGVAPGVKKALIGKVLGPQGGSSESIVSAIQWATDNGAHVISMSLGMDFPGLVEFWQGQGMPVALATSRALEAYRANVQLFERLAALIRAQGAFLQPTVIVAAAGNESRREQNPDFEIAVAPPAVAEGVVSVAALGKSNTGFSVATFSNTGANLSGPGVQIVSAKPGGGFQSMSGTSMATPHVAGVMALWAEKIKASGQFSALNLTSRVIGAAVTEGIQAGFDPFDVGAGMARAPQS
jgi:subtilisin family serine protease